mgnify:CR=1 FL=1
MKRALVLTGGGDCPGLNAVIRAIVKRASQEKDWEILGSIQAFNGVLWEPSEIVRLTPESVRGIHFRGGTILETTNKGGPFSWPVKNNDGTWTTVDRSDEMIRKLQYMGIDFVINIGGDGIVVLDGVEYPVNHRDGIYVGMGTKELVFKSVDKNDPAKFYINSCPAHRTCPTVHIPMDKARYNHLGGQATVNERILRQYIHPAVCESCQLSMGMTALLPGNVWNTMPSHTHERRMEIYTYFEVPENQVVFHMMGEPNETRHIVMRNEEAVISPSWSIHAGVGTRAYSFIWAMCGENQEFTDMDFIETKDLR